MRVFCFFVFCAWSDQTDFVALFWGGGGLIGGVFHALFLSLVVFFTSVPVTTRGLDLFSGACLNGLRISVVPRD